jgi:TPR repeat protein
MFLEFDGGSAAGLMGHVTEEVSFYDRGFACARLSDAMDLVEAHKWFNLAAMAGDPRGAGARADIAMDLTPREIAEAQRRARAFARSRH